MRRPSRFVISGLIGTVDAGAVVQPVVAGAASSGSVWREDYLLVGSFVAMPVALWVDTCLLIRRAGEGRPPYGRGWSESTFNRGLCAVAACLWLPFTGHLLGGHGGGGLAVVVLLPLTSVLAGAAVLIPLHWLVPWRTPFEFPLMALVSTLLIMGLVRLAARGRVGWACGLALVIASFSSAVLRNLFSD